MIVHLIFGLSDEKAKVDRKIVALWRCQGTRGSGNSLLRAETLSAILFPSVVKCFRMMVAMNNKRTRQIDTRALERKPAIEVLGLSNEILHLASYGVQRIEFLRKVAKMLLDFSGCDLVELRLKQKGGIKESSPSGRCPITGISLPAAGRQIFSFLHT